MCTFSAFSLMLFRFLIYPLAAVQDVLVYLFLYFFFYDNKFLCLDCFDAGIFFVVTAVFKGGHVEEETRKGFIMV